MLEKELIVGEIYSQVNNEWENEITFEQFERFILNKPKTIQWLWNL